MKGNAMILNIIRHPIASYRGFIFGFRMGIKQNILNDWKE